MAIKLIVGLGNEGREYEKTYHNVGRLCAEVYEHEKAVDVSVRFFQPPGFMNVIGTPIAGYLRNTSIVPEEVLIIHDDSDLPLGSFKVSLGGSSAGHKGVQNIIENLGTEKFRRLRIGVRDPRQAPAAGLPSDQPAGGQESRRAKAGLPAKVPRAKAGDFVLKKIPASEEKQLRQVFDQAWEELMAQQLLRGSA